MLSGRTATMEVVLKAAANGLAERQGYGGLSRWRGALKRSMTQAEDLVCPVQEKQETAKEKATLAPRSAGADSQRTVAYRGPH